MKGERENEDDEEDDDKSEQENDDAGIQREDTVIRSCTRELCHQDIEAVRGRGTIWRALWGG